MTLAKALLEKELRAKWVTLLIFCLLAGGFAVMYIAMFPAIRQQAAQLSQIMSSMTATLKAMGIQDVGFTSLDGFLSLEYFSLLWPIMTIILLASWTSDSLAGEIERGSLGLLLSLPFGRQRIYWAKYAAVTFGLVVFSLCSIVAIIPIAHLFNLEVVASHYWRAVVMCWLFAWSFMSAGFLLSAVWSEKGKVAMAMGGLALLMYVANAVAGLRDSLGWLKHLSFFAYLDIQNVLVNSHWSWTAVGVFVGVSLLASAAGAYWFNRRDIAV